MASIKKTNTKYVELLVLTLLIAAELYVLLDVVDASALKPESLTEKVILNIGIVLVGFLAIGMHELGHLLVGLAKGFQFQFFVVGFLGIRREEERVKIYFNTNLAYFGGVASTTPRENKDSNAEIFAQILLAGPLASLVFAGFCFVLTWFLPIPYGLILYIGGAISTTLFFVTVIPSKTGMFFTDRKRYQRLIKPGKAREVELAILSVMGSFMKDNSYQGVQIKDLDMLIADDEPFVRFYGLFNSICRQIELEGRIDDNTLKVYQETASEVGKSVAAGFDKEIEAFKAKHIVMH